MHHVFRVRSNAAEQTENRLHEERGLYQAAIGKMRQVVKVRSVVAFELKPRPVAIAGLEHVLDILERVAEDEVTRSFEVLPLPVMLEFLESVEHRVESEIH